MMDTLCNWIWEASTHPRVERRSGGEPFQEGNKVDPRELLRDNATERRRENILQDSE